MEADPDQLEQLLINIVRNAVDATMGTGGKVWIDWTTRGGYLQLTVEDEGPGLPDTTNLFVPFFTRTAPTPKADARCYACLRPLAGMSAAKPFDAC